MLRQAMLSLNHEILRLPCRPRSARRSNARRMSEAPRDFDGKGPYLSGDQTAEHLRVAFLRGAGSLVARKSGGGADTGWRAPAQRRDIDFGAPVPNKPDVARKRMGTFSFRPVPEISFDDDRDFFSTDQ
jgi:hypothetical protein